MAKKSKLDGGLADLMRAVLTDMEADMFQVAERALVEGVKHGRRSPPDYSGCPKCARLRKLTNARVRRYRKASH